VNHKIMHKFNLLRAVKMPLVLCTIFLCLSPFLYSADTSFKGSYLPWASRIITLTGVDASGTVTATNLQINGSGTFADDVQINDDLNVSSEGTFASIVVTGLTEGTIDNVVIGGSTAKAGTFTTLIGTAGTINGSTIGGTSAGAGTFTNLTANGTFTATGGTIDGIPIGATTSSAARFLYLTSAGMTLTSTIQGGADAALGDLTLTGDIVTAVGANFSGNITVVDINSTGNISGSSSAFTTAVFTEVPNGFMVDGTVTATSFSGDGSGITNLSAGTQIVDGDAHATASDGVSIIFDVDGGGNEMTILTTSVGIGTPTPSKELTVNGEITASSEISSSTTVSGTTLTASTLITAPQGTFTNISGNGTGIGGVVHTATNETINGTKTFSDIDVDGGYIDGTPIGQTSASNAKFGIVTATTANLTTINATTINGTINTATQGTITDIGTQVTADINGGYIDGTPIGQNVASNAIFGTATATTGNFTTINATTINGTLGAAAQPNITSLGALARVTATDFDGSNGNFSGTVTGQLKGGNTPTVSGTDSASLGGLRNIVSGDYSSVAAGTDNTASGNYSFIGGGIQNSASDTYSTVLGGLINAANGFNSSVLGGSNNFANGDRSLILGGQNLTVTGENVVAFRNGNLSSPITLTASYTMFLDSMSLCVKEGNECTASSYSNGEIYTDRVWADEALHVDAPAGAAYVTIDSADNLAAVYLKSATEGSDYEWAVQVTASADALLIGTDTGAGANHAFHPNSMSINGVNPAGYTLHVNGTEHVTGAITSDTSIDAPSVKVSGVSLVLPSYGGLYIADDSITQVTISAAGHYATTSTWTKSVDKSGFLTDSQGNSDHSTYPSDGFIVDTNGAGIYNFQLQVTASGTNNAEVKIYPHIDGVIMAGCGIKLKLDSGGSSSRGAVSCLQTLSVGEFVDVRITADGAGNTVAISPGNFTLTRVDNN